MTLQLGVKLSLDKSGFVPAAQEATKSVADIGASAERAAVQVRGLGEVSTAATAATTSGARATIAAASAQTAASNLAAKASTDHAGAMRITAAQALDLSYQMNDVFTSLMGGISPIQTLVQQGPQIAQSFGGVGNTFRLAFSYLTPFRIGLGLAATALGVAAKATLDHSAAMKEAEVAAAGLGRNVGTSAGEIDRIARSSADGGQVTVSAARSMATEFTRTGKIGKENFGELVGVVRNFALATSTDTATATKTLADLMADPAKAAETLSQSMGLIDASTARFVRRLADQGQKTEAVSVLTKTLGANLADVGKTVSWYAQMWGLVERAASGAADAIGRAVAPKVGKDLIQDLEGRVEALKKQGTMAPGLQGNAPSAPGYGMWADKGPSAPEGEKARQAEIRRLEGEIAKLKKEEADAEARRQAAIVDAARSRAVDIAGASGSPAVQEAQRRQQLLDEQKKLREAGTGPTKMSDAEQQAERDRMKASEDARIAAALDAKTRALTTWISESQRAQQLAEIDLQISATRDPIERAELERKRALVTTAGQEIGTAEANAAANAAYARSIGEVSAQARGSIADTLADAAARERVNALVTAGVLPIVDMNRELQIEAATRQLVMMAAKAEGAEKERLLGLIAQTRAAITAQTEAQKAANAAQEVRSGDDRLQTLRTQIALVGQSEASQARVLALLEAEQKIRSQGYAGTAADQIRARAVAEAELNTTLERQKAAWSEVQNTGGSAIDTLIEGMRAGKDVGKQMADDLSKEFLKLAVANPLKNMLFGQNLPTMTDVGGVLGNLFGGGDKAAAGAALPSAVGTATITAATVIINGSGVGGAGGIASAASGIFSDSALNRSSFAAELANPAIRNKLFAMTEAEVGGQGAQAQQAFMETIFNRGSARGMSLDQVLSDKAYFPKQTFDNAQRWMGGGLDAKYGDALGRVRGGSNLANYATGNASGDVGFGGGPQTAAFGGEKFGVEKADMSWAKLQQSSSQTAQSIGSLGTSSNTAVDAVAKLGTGTDQAANALTSSSGGIAQASNQMGTTITTTAATTQSAFGQLTSGLGSAFSSLFSGLGNMLGGIGGGIGHLFGFADGGWTGSAGRTTVTGFVHGQEYVVNAAATAKNRPLLEAINAGYAPRGYASGGYVGTMPMMGAAPALSSRSGNDNAAPVIHQTFVNNSTAHVSTHEESDGKGGRRQVIAIEEAVGAAIGRPRSATQRAIQTAYGLQTKVTRR